MASYPAAHHSGSCETLAQPARSARSGSVSSVAICAAPCSTRSRATTEPTPPQPCTSSRLPATLPPSVASTAPNTPYAVAVLGQQALLPMAARTCRIHVAASVHLAIECGEHRGDLSQQLLLVIFAPGVGRRGGGADELGPREARVVRRVLERHAKPQAHGFSLRLVVRRRAGRRRRGRDGPGCSEAYGEPGGPRRLRRRSGGRLEKRCAAAWRTRRAAAQRAPPREYFHVSGGD
eukprot:scaffold44705_cov24-Tisochrysis_lutea.AAC.5